MFIENWSPSSTALWAMMFASEEADGSSVSTWNILAPTPPLIFTISVFFSVSTHVWLGSTVSTGDFISISESYIFSLNACFEHDELTPVMTQMPTNMANTNAIFFIPYYIISRFRAKITKNIAYKVYKTTCFADFNTKIDTTCGFFA